jgi:hypothetical protein
MKVAIAIAKLRDMTFRRGGERRSPSAQKKAFSIGDNHSLKRRHVMAQPDSGRLVPQAIEAEGDHFTFEPMNDGPGGPIANRFSRWKRRQMFKILSVAAVAVLLALPAGAGVLDGAARPLAGQNAKTLALSADTGVSVADIQRFHVILNGYGIPNDDADDELKNIVEDEGRMRAGTLNPGFARCWKSRGATPDMSPDKFYIALIQGASRAGGHSCGF